MRYKIKEKGGHVMQGKIKIDAIAYLQHTYA